MKTDRQWVYYTQASRPFLSLFRSNHTEFLERIWTCWLTDVNSGIKKLLWTLSYTWDNSGYPAASSASFSRVVSSQTLPHKTSWLCVIKGCSQIQICVFEVSFSTKLHPTGFEDMCLLMAITKFVCMVLVDTVYCPNVSEQTMMQGWVKADMMSVVIH